MKTRRKKAKPRRRFAALKRRASSVRRRAKRKFNYNDRWKSVTWLLPVALVVLALGVLFKPKTQYPISLSSAKLVGFFEKTQTMNMGDRIAFWSEGLYRNPNLLAPLGSGPEINDTAPLFPHGYDCTTYVETVGALSQSHTGEDLADRLIGIRYKDGKISYENRNHFPEADWIPNNENYGNLRDITVQIARKAGYMVGFAHKDVDKIAWFKAQKNVHANRAVANAMASDSMVTVKLPYLPMDKILDSLQHIPQGAVINIVRESKDKYPVLISHQGFLVWKNGVAYFRHASSNKEIREMRFVDYLNTARRMPWKVLGFNVNVFKG